MNDLLFFDFSSGFFPEKIKDKLSPYIQEKKYPKGHILFSSDKLERNIYVIKQGIARAYVVFEDKEVTIWFGQENDVIISAQGYVCGEKGYETMELLEDSVLYEIELSRLTSLYHDDIDLCNWGRQLIEREFVRTERHLIANLAQSAKERYLYLMRSKKPILQRVQLQYIASYLGISPEYLSRIRSGIKNK